MSATPQDWEAFLLALGLPRLGPATAKRLVEALGPELLEALGEAERLSALKGVGPATAKGWAQAWRATPAWGALARWLLAEGFSPLWAVAWAAELGPDALALLREDPLALAQVGPPGAAGLAVAKALGHAPDALPCLALALHGALEEAWAKGAFGVPLASLAQRLGRRPGLKGLPEASWWAAAQALAARALACLRPDEGGAWLLHGQGAWALEGALAEALAHLASRGPEGGTRLGQAAEAALALSPHLDGDQQGAVRALVAAPLGLLVGGPGSGKTTALRALVAAWEASGLSVALASPTGRAARRLGEAVGREATTLHKLLACDASGLPLHGPARPLPAEVVVVDEAGMLDLELAAMVVAAIAGPTRLLLVGDPDQLPPVGPGQPFADLLASGLGVQARLGGAHRQAAGGPLAQAAAAWRQGQLPELPRPAGDGALGAFFWPTEDEASALRAVVGAVQRGLPERLGLRPDEVQVIAERHAGPLGTVALNQAIQAALGRPQGPTVALADRQLAGVGDRVMARANRHELGLANGDAGQVLRVGPQGLEVAFPSGPLWVPAREAVGLLGLAYAISGHKAQGSGFLAVICPFPPGRAPSNAWTYTAFTRAERLWVGVGDRQAWAASLGQTEAPRHTALAPRLRAAAAALGPG